MAGSRSRGAVIQTDRVVAAYLFSTAILVLVFRADVPRWSWLLLAHLLGAIGVSTLRRLPERLPPALGFFREWYPVLLFPVLYKEVELFAGAFGRWSLTEPVQRLEVLLFGSHPSLFLSERFAAVPLSEYLHFCYVSYVLWLPVIGGLWYFGGKRAAFHELLFLTTVTFSVSYLLYSLFPVLSPFYLLEPPGPPLAGRFFYELVHFVSDSGGARGGAFPSSHVSISTVILLVALRHDRRLLPWLVPLYVGLVFATVYGRFHYAVDVFAGWVLSAVVVGAFWLTSARGSSRSPFRPRCRG